MSPMLFSLPHCIRIISYIGLFFLAFPSPGQDKKLSFRDSTDNQLDLSSFLLDPHGFVPIFNIITEPAVGGFGVIGAPLFIQKKEIEDYEGFIQPDLTSIFGMYTVNNSWGVGGLRVGTFPKAGIKYTLFAGYFSLNLDYYRELPVIGERAFAFNKRSVPFTISVSKELIRKSKWYAGLKYSYARSELVQEFEGEVPEFIQPLELDNKTSSLGMLTRMDRRNTIFTPDKGILARINYDVNADWTGSDFNFQLLSTSVLYFIPVKANWISGFRGEFNHAIDDPPFYMLPSVDMRGIPAVRYQGATTILLETEQRFDITPRWSIVGFTGIGKALERDEGFGDGQTVYNVGTGFRYLMARLFKLRAGIDIARGPDEFAWYIVFGHSWNN